MTQSSRWRWRTVIDSEQKIRAASRARITRLFGCREGSLRDRDRFDSDLKPSFKSDFRYNEIDQILHDIRDVADKSNLRELNSGRIEIRTVGDYCDHMVRCYATVPEEVEAVIGKVK